MMHHIAFFTAAGPTSVAKKLWHPAPCFHILLANFVYFLVLGPEPVAKEAPRSKHFEAFVANHFENFPTVPVHPVFEEIRIPERRVFAVVAVHL